MKTITNIGEELNGKTAEGKMSTLEKEQKLWGYGGKMALTTYWVCATDCTLESTLMLLDTLK